MEESAEKNIPKGRERKGRASSISEKYWRGSAEVMQHSRSKEITSAQPLRYLCQRWCRGSATVARRLCSAVISEIMQRCMTSAQPLRNRCAAQSSRYCCTTSALPLAEVAQRLCRGYFLAALLFRCRETTSAQSLQYFPEIVSFADKPRPLPLSTKRSDFAYFRVKFYQFFHQWRIFSRFFRWGCLEGHLSPWKM